MSSYLEDISSIPTTNISYSKPTTNTGGGSSTVPSGGGSTSSSNNNQNKDDKNTSRNYKNKPSSQPGDTVRVENAKPDPDSIVRNVNRFFKNGSTNWTAKITGTSITVSKIIPGVSGGDARAVYNKVIDYTGQTLLVYKNSFNSAGEFVHTKIKLIVDMF